ncbi:hypothetical protein [Acetobacter syzygii]|nr:hypothetical protein [Acetobacter syzygii]
MCRPCLVDAQLYYAGCLCRLGTRISHWVNGSSLWRRTTAHHNTVA